MKTFLPTTLCIGVVFVAASCAHAQTEAPAITDFGHPFLFAYGTWEKNARVENGRLELDTPSSQGGLGDNVALDLSQATDSSPVLRLRLGEGNTLKTLRLMLRDQKGGNATWNFSLEGIKTGEDVDITPVGGASLGQPNEVGKEGAPDLKGISQWQVQGDWTTEKAQVSLDSIGLRAPDEAIRAARQLRQARMQAEGQKLQQEHQAQIAQFARGPLSPVVTHTAPVAPDVVAVTIHAGHVQPGSVVPYHKQSGDTTRETKTSDGRLESVVLSRGGKDLGWLIGPERNFLTARATFEGDPLLEWLADDARQFSLSSTDDPFFSEGIKAVSVARKSKAGLWAEDSADFEVDHTLYLRLPQPLTQGKHYTLHFGKLNTRQEQISWVNEAAKTRSEAVHVSQIGFRPDDPVKTAWVSCWMGTGGAMKLPPSLAFSLVDEKSGKVVFSGRSTNVWPVDKPEHMAREANFSGTDVMRLDFSTFKTPGRYHVAVEGVGSSFSFSIGPDVWKKAFLIQVKGLYNQRSGIEVGPPYSSFRKPRDMNPADDGVRVTWTKYRAVEAGGEAFDRIVAGDTGQSAPGWGGYHDAGDWNPRRVTHMKATLALLEAFENRPQFFAALKLGIPPRANMPDVLTEAIFELETFHRLQQKDGGVGYGLETQGDPFPGEVSWLQSMPIYALSPDYASSWFYALVAARLAHDVASYDSKLASTYRDSSIRAFEFAERDFARDHAAGLTDKRGDTWQALDSRNFAALELYRLTRDAKWHTLFLENSVLKEANPKLFAWGKAVQRDQAFVYARLPANLGDKQLKRKAVAAIETLADRTLNYARNNAWNLSTPDQSKPQFLGFYSVPDATDLVHAHVLTGKEKYLAGAVAATSFQSGANPNNMVYISGLGANPVHHPFSLDARRTGEKEPVGLVPYGNVDFGKWGDQAWITWPITYFLSKNTTPNPLEWPTNEAYFDTGGWPAINEYTVDTWAPNIVLWGYLAARPLKAVR